LFGKERKEWVVARLAGTGNVEYVEVDTAFHPGNYPVVSEVRQFVLISGMQGRGDPV